MEKLKRGQRRGCPDVWTESGGEDRIVRELSAFGNLNRKICWNNPMWEMLAAKIFKEKNVKKKKWLYTVWHSDRKLIRTRVLLRQKKKIECTSQNFEKNEDEEKRDKGSEDRLSVVEDISLTCEQKKSPEICENEHNTLCGDRLDCGREVQHESENQVSKDEEKTLEMEEKIEKNNEDTIVMAEASGESIETDSIVCPDESLFCICKQPNNPTEPYAQCNLCHDWFHPVCVGIQSIEDIAAISPWHCPSSTRDTQKIQSGHKDQVKRRLSFGQEIPSCPQEFTVSLTRTEWAAIQPAKRKGYRVLKKGWTDLLSRKIGSINKFCVLSFKSNKIKCSQSRKNKQAYWRGKALCKFSGCTTYFLSLEKDPNDTEGDIPVTVKAQGKIHHSCHKQHSRHCRQPERHTLRGQLGECSPMLVHTKQLASADEEKILAGNLNDVKSVLVLQKISSEKNLANRLDMMLSWSVQKFRKSRMWKNQAPS